MTAAELIQQKVKELPAGQPFTPAKFLSIAERSTVDKALARLVSTGFLTKPSRGVFVRPKESKFGIIPPKPFEIAVAKVHGALIEISGADAALRFGLSTQVPVRLVFYTTGRSRTFKVGKLPVKLQHVSPRKLVYPGTKAGMVISALWYLGKEQVNHEVFEIIRSKLTPKEYTFLKASASQMPGWMADALHKYEKVGIMVDFFINLPKEQQSALLKQSAPRTNMRPFVLEKDIWVCWALQQLFAIPEPHPMAFKGGTSLSKVYQVIDRFSEDLDITLDYRGFVEVVKGDESRSKIIRLSEKLKSFLLEYTRDKVKPYFEKVMSEQFGKGAGRIDLSDDGEKLYIHYPSVFDDESTEYLSSSVLLEFGGRNITEPNEERKVSPYISRVLPGYLFPEPTVTVLALQRTYWEKATLIHVECHRPNERPETSRLSRHWYDLYQMSNNLSDFQSSDAHKVLRDVVRYKKAFFHYSYANYDLCLSGGLRLVPSGKLKTALEVDFKSMVDVGMFYNEPPSFQKILDRLAQVEQAFNESINT